MEAPPPLADSVHASQVSTVPKQRSRLRSGSKVSSSQATLVADWFGAIEMPCRAELEARAERAEVLPAEGRADRLAGRPVPHDRGRPLVGDADGLDRAAGGQGLAGDLEHGGASAVASNSTRPAKGVSGGKAR